jgi:6-phosphofructokinase 2
MVAGLLSVISSEDGNAVKALKLGIACGSGTVQKPGTELFTMDLVDKLVDIIQIEQLKL